MLVAKEGDKVREMDLNLEMDTNLTYLAYFASTTSPTL